MVKIIDFIIIIYCLITLIIFSVDFYYFLLERYGRYHIGRFSSEKEWKQKTIKKAVKWLKREPTVKITDNNRYILLDKITKKYRNNTIQSWQKGALLLGVEKYKNICENEIKQCIDSIINEKGEYIKKPSKIDCGLLAYAILKNSDPDKVKPAMKETANIILNNIGDDGMVRYINDKESTERYVDTLGLAIPFLFAYSRVYNMPEIQDIAFEQIKKFTKYGLEKDSLLPVHAFDSKSKLPLGVYGWGRGCAWYILSLIDSYMEIQGEEKSQWIKEQIHRIAEQYKQFQKEDGGFGYIIQMREGYDSSVTAVMAYFYKKCYEIWQDKDYEDVYKKCLSKLRTVTKINGELDWCQGDTKNIGVFSQNFSIMPFAQGMMLRSFEEK